jgi:hypothetical protein
MANHMKQERDDAKRQLWVAEDVRKQQAVTIQRLSGAPEALDSLSTDEIDKVIQEIEGALARAVSVCLFSLVCTSSALMSSALTSFY